MLSSVSGPILIDFALGEDERCRKIAESTGQPFEIVKAERAAREARQSARRARAAGGIYEGDDL